MRKTERTFSTYTYAVTNKVREFYAIGQLRSLLYFKLFLTHFHFGIFNSN